MTAPDGLLQLKRYYDWAEWSAKGVWNTGKYVASSPVAKVGWWGTKLVTNKIIDYTPIGYVKNKVQKYGKTVLILGAIGVAAYSGYTAYQWSSNAWFPFSIPARIADIGATTAKPLLTTAFSAVNTTATGVFSAVGDVIGQATQGLGGFAMQKFTDLSAYIATEGLPTITMKVVSTVASGVLQMGIGIVRNSTKEVWALVAIYAGTIFSFSYGAKIIGDVYDYCSLRAKYAIGAPKLNVEYRPAVRLGAVGRKVAHFFREKMVRPVYSQEVQEQFDVIKHRLENIQKNNAAPSFWKNPLKWVFGSVQHTGYLPNLILEGPPGTGKSMFANYLATETGMRYVKMNGADLAQYIKRGEHVSELNKMLDWAHKGKEPTILFIDEAEAMVGSREGLDQQHKELLNAFLAETGDPSKKVMVVMATNRLGDLDEAVISRADLKMHIGPPDYASRKKILRQYINKYMENEPDLLEMFDDKFVGQIAAATANLTGRTLSKMVYEFIATHRASGNKQLTKKDVFKVVGRFIDQERRMPKSARSWRIVELPRDFYYFTLPRIQHAVWRALVYVKNTIVSIPRLPGYLWHEGLPKAGRSIANAPGALWRGAKRGANYACFWKERKAKPQLTDWQKFKNRVAEAAAA